MPFDLASIDWGGQLSAFFQVLMIDLVLAGDNAVAVGLAAAGLPDTQRRKVIFYGLAAAVALRIGFALITVQLLAIIGLLLAGGILLLWVCWKMWRELRNGHGETMDGDESLDNVHINPDGTATLAPRKTFGQAAWQIVIADVSMSLDNVLAVAGAAREHPYILIFGLLLSIVLMGVAATWIAKLLHKHRWIGYVGLIIVLWVALHMIWEGHREVVVDMDWTAQYNASAPGFLDIGPEEVEKIRSH